MESVNTVSLPSDAVHGGVVAAAPGNGEGREVSGQSFAPAGPFSTPAANKSFARLRRERDRLARELESLKKTLQQAGKEEGWMEGTGVPVTKQAAGAEAAGFAAVGKPDGAAKPAGLAASGKPDGVKAKALRGSAEAYAPERTAGEAAKALGPDGQAGTAGSASAAGDSDTEQAAGGAAAGPGGKDVPEEAAEEMDGSAAEPGVPGEEGADSGEGSNVGGLSVAEVASGAFGMAGPAAGRAAEPYAWQVTALLRERAVLQRLLYESQFEKDLQQLKSLFPLEKVSHVSELGDDFMALRAAGVDNVTAFVAVQLAKNLRKPPEPGAVGSAAAEEGEFFSSREIDHLSEKDLEDPKVLEKAIKSMTKWKK